MESAKIFVFDLDQTLTESKAPLDAEMLVLLRSLLQIKKVAVLSGASFEQFEKQVLRYLICPPELLTNLYLLPTNGAGLYEYKNEWQQVYLSQLTEAEKKEIFQAFDEAFTITRFEKPETVYGVLIEDRGTQITFSGLGSEAPLHLKELWDPHHEKREKVAAELRKRLPHFTVSIGGSTSIDVTRRGIDKAYGLTKLMEHLHYAKKDVLYIGDALFPGGNDEAILQMGIHTVSVADPGIGDTKEFIRRILAKLQPAADI